MKKIILTVCFLLATRWVCYAAPSNSISTPNSFTPGTTIQSSQVNANFTHIQNTYNTHTHTDITQLGTVTIGVWDGTAIGVQFGGTGQNFSAVTQGAVPYFSATGVMSTLSAGSSGQVLSANGSSANPSWKTLTFGASSVTPSTIMVSDTLGYATTFLKTYDSGWFAVAVNKTYTSGSAGLPAYTLGTNKAIVKLFLSSASDGSTGWYDVTGQLQVNYHLGSWIKDFTSSQITVQTESSHLAFDNTENYIDSGYYRILIMALQ
jgi:hypothetical protein